jgi:Calcineurin-like phosphoesterase
VIVRRGLLSRRALLVAVGPLISAGVLAASGGCGDNQLAPTSDAGLQSDTMDAVTDSGPPPTYSFVVLPDTQYYASSWPEIFEKQTEWLIANRDVRQIAFVLHTGDIVDADNPTQWEVASRSLHALDDQIPYVITAGNHDYKNLANRMGMGNEYFPVSGFAAFPWFGGTFEPEHVENSYSRFSVGTRGWLVVALEFGPRDEVLAWADGILKQFSSTPAIIITHAYLAHDNRRYDFNDRRGQQFNPHEYVMAGQPGTSINDGEEIWRKVVEPNRNVKLVFSGHDVSGSNLPPGTAGHLTSVRQDGSSVHQILANYQTCLGSPCECLSPPCGSTSPLVHGGNGYLRILVVAEAEGTISVQTYSPYVDQVLSDPNNQFVLPIN